MPRRVAIVGVGLTRCSSWRKDVAYPELVYEATSAALQDAGITPNDVNAVVYGCMDPFDGVNAPEKWNVDACAAAPPRRGAGGGGAASCSGAAGEPRGRRGRKSPPPPLASPKSRILRSA